MGYFIVKGTFKGLEVLGTRTIFFYKSVLCFPNQAAFLSA